MPEVQTQEQGLRFGTFFRWGGLIIAVLGVLLALRGDYTTGIILVVAGVAAWLFAKRRTRNALE